MKEYYLARLHWIFTYTNKKWWYCIVKTLCLVVGVPIYAVSFVVEMVLTFINMLFSWIPFFNMVIMVICKLLITVFGSTFYICILPDIKQYNQAVKEVSYEVVNTEFSENEQTADQFETSQTVSQQISDEADGNTEELS